MRKVTVSRMRERYAQTVLTFRITYVLHKVYDTRVKHVSMLCYLYTHSHTTKATVLRYIMCVMLFVHTDYTDLQFLTDCTNRQMASTCTYFHPWR